MPEKSFSRLDTLDKVKGKARYADDLYFPDMLFAQTVHCPHPHAEILSIDAKEALKIPGVFGVYTAEDVPGVNQAPRDKPMIAGPVARHVGDGVAVVAAETEEIAKRAAKLVRVEYKELPALLDPDLALSDGVPLVHEQGNLACEHKVTKGNLDEGFAQADVILEREYRTQRIAHSAIEPDVAVAVPENGGITVYAPCKNPYGCKRAIAKACGFPQSKVRMIQPVIGGSFGGKDIDTIVVAVRATVVALKTGRPCKMRWSREEVLEEGSKRQPFILRYKIGAKKDGKITALRIDGISDVGAYITKSLGIIWRATVEAGGPYQIDNLHTHIKGVFTHRVVCDAVRGFGSPQVDFASESMMDELAKELGLSPFEIRRRNCLKSGGTAASGQVLKDVGLSGCMDMLESYFPDWNEMGKVKDGKVRGFGLGCLYRGESYGAAFADRDFCDVDLRLHQDGSIDLMSSLSEVGQSGHTTMALVAADTLGISVDRIHIQPVDTAYVPDSGATVGSRGTISGGNAVLDAALQIKSTLARLAGEKLGIAPESLVFRNDNIYASESSQDVLMSFNEVAAICYSKAENGFAHGRWVSPALYWDHERGQGTTYYSYSYAVGATEIEVDLTSGKIDVKRLICLHDLGKVLNYAEASAQIAGGIVMAMGYATTEDAEGRKNGDARMNFDEYLLPTSADVFEVDAIPVEIEQESSNPLGVHGVGEVSVSLIAPCVTNALDNALGIRVRELPLTLEKVRAALDKQRKEQ